MLRLIGGGTGNGGDLLVDFRDADDHLAQKIAGLVHELRTARDALGAGRDQVLDLACRLGRPLRQGANFVGDDGEALAAFTGTCGLDPGVQRQQIGLEGDAVDQVGDLFDLDG